jgi:hypothetical protein
MDDALLMGIAFAAAALATASIRALAPRVGLMDAPNERSSHDNLVPRGGWPFNRRTMSVTAVSTVKMESRTRQAQNICGAAAAQCTIARPNTRPRKPLPTSPMKMRARGKFQMRKPSVAAARSSGADAAPGCPT